MIDYRNTASENTNIVQLLKKAGNHILLAYHRLFRSSRTFTFNGRVYKYFYHIYNTAWKNERAVEIPILWDIVQHYSGKNILEVGNVLSHYYPVTHTIIDMYEKAPGVLNQDAVDHRTERPYDLIIAISTLEHVGFDEEHIDPPKVLRAIDNLKKCLAPGGMLVATIPIGYNHELDAYLAQGKVRFDRMYCLKRTSANNDWIGTEWKDIHAAKFGHPFRAANGLVIGMIDKPGS